MADAAFGPACTSGPFACRSDLDDRAAWLPHRRRWPCPASHLPTRDGWGVINAAIASARRWGAIGVFRLARRILRCASTLHRQRRIYNKGLRTFLSGTRLLYWFVALLALGRRRPPPANRTGFSQRTHRLN